MAAGGWFRADGRHFQKMSSGAAGGYALPYDAAGRPAVYAGVDGPAEPQLWWFINDTAVAPAAAAAPAPPAPPAPLTAAGALAVIAERLPVSRTVPHTRTEDCRTAFPGYWRLWCDRCLARACLGLGGDWQADVADCLRAGGQGDRIGATPGVAAAGRGVAGRQAEVPEKKRG